MNKKHAPILRFASEKSKMSKSKVISVTTLKKITSPQSPLTITYRMDGPQETASLTVLTVIRWFLSLLDVHTKKIHLICVCCKICLKKNMIIISCLVLHKQKIKHCAFEGWSITTITGAAEGPKIWGDRWGKTHIYFAHRIRIVKIFCFY